MLNLPTFPTTFCLFTCWVPPLDELGRNASSVLPRLEALFYTPGVSSSALTRGFRVLVWASTLRRWRHARGWVGKRAQVVAREDDPQRVEKLARIRHTLETLGKRAVVRLADELDLHLLPKVAYQWMPQGTTLKLVTPGPNHKHYLAGALEPQSGQLGSCTSLRNTNALFRMLRDRLEGRYPQTQFATVSVVVDNSAIHKARAVERGLAAHPRFELLFLPTSCPPANPIERVCGDVHDHCTRHHQRTRLEALGQDLEPQFARNGSWPSPPLAPLLRSSSDGRTAPPHPRTAFTASGMNVPFSCRLV
jgi:hypothetical protein